MLDLVQLKTFRITARAVQKKQNYSWPFFRHFCNAGQVQNFPNSRLCALHWAATYNTPALIQAMVEESKPDKDFINVLDSDGFTALMMAFSSCSMDVDTIKMLLHLGSDCDLLVANMGEEKFGNIDRYHWSALHFAVIYGTPELTELVMARCSRETIEMVHSREPQSFHEILSLKADPKDKEACEEKIIQGKCIRIVDQAARAGKGLVVASPTKKVRRDNHQRWWPKGNFKYIEEQLIVKQDVKAILQDIKTKMKNKDKQWARGLHEVDGSKVKKVTSKGMIEQVEKVMTGGTDERVEVREITDPTHPAHKIDESTGKPCGYGLFVKQGCMVPYGTIICEYLGEVRTEDDMWVHSHIIQDEEYKKIGFKTKVSPLLMFYSVSTSYCFF